MANTEGVRLYPYQIEGADWLATQTHALLADEMGLGKSAQAIRAADIISAKRIFVICPAALRVNWEREFTKFSKLSRTFTVCMDMKSKFSLSCSVISSYDLVTLNKKDYLNSWDLLILDEAHFLKNHTAKRTKAIFGKEGVVRHAKRVWALTGTPAPNHAAELWPLLYTFGKTPLTYDEFLTRYCSYYVTPHRTKQVTGLKKEHLPELKKTLESVMLRRKKEDVMKELPPIRFSEITVAPSPVDIDIQSSFVQYIFPVDRREELRKKLLFEMDYLKKITSMPAGHDAMRALEAISSSISTLRRYAGLQKVPAVIEMVKGELESRAYEKIVIFAIHRDVIESLRVGLIRYGTVTLYGGTDPGTKQRNVDRFQANPMVRVFIGNIQAAGAGINLTVAHQVLFIEQSFVAGENAQASFRCHRIGQTKPVSVRFVSLNNSIDQKVTTLLRRKTRDLAALFDKQIQTLDEEFTPITDGLGRIENKPHNKKINVDEVVTLEDFQEQNALIRDEGFNSQSQ